MLKLNLLAASACVFVTESLAETRVIGGHFQRAP